MAGSRPRARGWGSSGRGHRCGTGRPPGAEASTRPRGPGGTAGWRPQPGRCRWNSGRRGGHARQDDQHGDGHGGVSGRRAGSDGPRRRPRRSAWRWRVPGLDNVRNAAAALAVVDELGADLERALAALAEFSGVGRRFERVGEVGGVMVVDDYAHHPTEVQATLAAARQAFPRRRVVAVFQPHLFSRTALHGDALGRALAAADVVVVAPIYGAREQPLPGVSAALVARGAVRAGATTVALRERATLTERVAETVQAGDVVFTLGAGDITRVGPELLARLRTGAGA